MAKYRQHTITQIASGHGQLNLTGDTGLTARLFCLLPWPKHHLRKTQHDLKKALAVCSDVLLTLADMLQIAYVLEPSVAPLRY